MRLLEQRYTSEDFSGTLLTNAFGSSTFSETIATASCEQPRMGVSKNPREDPSRPLILHVQRWPFDRHVIRTPSEKQRLIQPQSFLDVVSIALRKSTR